MNHRKIRYFFVIRAVFELMCEGEADSSGLTVHFLRSTEFKHGEFHHSVKGLGVSQYVREKPFVAGI